MIPEWSPVTYHYIQDYFQRRANAFPVLAASGTEDEINEEFSIFAYDVNFFSNLYGPRPLIYTTDLIEDYLRLFKSLANSELAEMPPDEFSRRCRAERHTQLSIGSEAFSFVDLDAPDVLKFYPKRSSRDYIQAMAVESVESLDYQKNGEPALGIFIKKAHHTSVLERYKFYREWPGFAESELTEFADCYRVKQKKLAPITDFDQLKEWLVKHRVTLPT